MTRPPITRVRLVTSASAVDTSTLAAEFPTVKIELGHAIRVDDAVIDADAWRTSKSFEPFDEAVARSRGDGLMVRGDRHVELVAIEALTRYQRFIERRNGSSRTPIFAAVLRAHRAMHDVSKPLVRADLDHALDTWQWMLRIDATASITAQLAALLHDVERLESEADVRVEHQANDYQAFKDAHAARGGVWAYEILQAAGVTPVIAERVREIITLHERRGRDPEIDLLNDADALSFMSLNSSGYLDYFGPEQTRRKLVYTLGRMGDGARKKLAHVRLRPDVRALFQRAIAA